MATIPRHLLERINVSQRLYQYLTDHINALKQNQNMPNDIRETNLNQLKVQAWDLSQTIIGLKQELREAEGKVPSRAEASSSGSLKRPQPPDASYVAHDQAKRSCKTRLSDDMSGNPFNQEKPDASSTTQLTGAPKSGLVGQTTMETQPRTISSVEAEGPLRPVDERITRRFSKRARVPHLSPDTPGILSGYQGVTDGEANRPELQARQSESHAPPLSVRPSPSVQNRRPVLPDSRLDMVHTYPTGAWMHSRAVGCIVFNKDTGEYFRVCCYRCGFNALERDGKLGFVSGIQGMRTHWATAHQCKGRGLNVDDMLASGTTEVLDEQKALQLVLNTGSIGMSRGDNSLSAAVRSN